MFPDSPGPDDRPSGPDTGIPSGAMRMGSTSRATDPVQETAPGDVLAETSGDPASPPVSDYLAGEIGALESMRRRRSA